MHKRLCTLTYVDLRWHNAFSNIKHASICRSQLLQTRLQRSHKTRVQRQLAVSRCLQMHRSTRGSSRRRSHQERNKLTRHDILKRNAMLSRSSPHGLHPASTQGAVFFYRRVPSIPPTSSHYTGNDRNGVMLCCAYRRIESC